MCRTLFLVHNRDHVSNFIQPEIHKNAVFAVIAYVVPCTAVDLKSSLVFTFQVPRGSPGFLDILYTSICPNFFRDDIMVVFHLCVMFCRACSSLDYTRIYDAGTLRLQLGTPSILLLLYQLCTGIIRLKFHSLLVFYLATVSSLCSVPTIRYDRLV